MSPAHIWLWGGGGEGTESTMSDFSSFLLGTLARRFVALDTTDLGLR